MLADQRMCLISEDQIFQLLEAGQKWIKGPERTSEGKSSGTVDVEWKLREWCLQSPTFPKDGLLKVSNLGGREQEYSPWCGLRISWLILCTTSLVSSTSLTRDFCLATAAITNRKIEPREMAQMSWPPLKKFNRRNSTHQLRLEDNICLHPAHNALRCELISPSEFLLKWWWVFSSCANKYWKKRLRLTQAIEIGCMHLITLLLSWIQLTM